MRIAYVQVKLKFPDNYTDEQILDIVSDCDYNFNYPVKDGDDQVQAIESEITEYTIK